MSSLACGAGGGVDVRFEPDGLDTAERRVRRSRRSGIERRWLGRDRERVVGRGGDRRRRLGRRCFRLGLVSAPADQTAARILQTSNSPRPDSAPI